MPINLENIEQAYKTLTPEEKERRKAAAQAKMQQAEKEGTESAKKTGSQIGGVLGGIAGALLTQSPQGALTGFKLGKEIGGGVAGAARGDMEGIEGAAQSAMKMSNLGAGNTDNIKKIEQMYKSGLIDKAKYDSLMSYFSEGGAEAAAGGMELIGGSLAGM